MKKDIFEAETKDSPQTPQSFVFLFLVLGVGVGSL